MKSPGRNDDVLRRLVNSQCNGSLSEDGVSQLDNLLAESPAARRAYLDYMSVEAELYSANATEFGEVAVTSGAATLETPAAGALPIRRVRSSLAIAASLIGVAIVSSLATAVVLRRAVNDTHANAASERQRPAAAAVVARIAATSNCRWREPGGQVGFGAELREGQRLELEAGVAEIVFESGALILLEGPAALDFTRRNAALLVSGRLSASVPAAADPLWIGTRRLGVSEQTQQGQSAEFGLLADTSGGGEVHVFGGLVNAHLLNPSGDEVRSVELVRSEAARVRPASTTVARFQADSDLFVRSLAPTVGPHDGLYAYEGFDYPAGPLSWQNGGFGWAGPWADIAADRSPNGGASTNVVAEAGLGAGDLAGVGNHAAQTSQRNRIRRALSTSVGGVFDTAGLVENRDGHRLLGSDGKRLYVSFAQRVDKTGDGFYGFEIHRGDGNGNRVLCIGNGAEGAGYGVTSNYNAYGPRNYLKLGDETTEVNFFVLKLEFGAGDRDTATVYRNPVSLVDESLCEPAGTLRGNFAFDRISLGNFDGTKQHSVDEVRLGTNYRAVTGRRDRPNKSFDRKIARWRRPGPLLSANRYLLTLR